MMKEQAQAVWDYWERCIADPKDEYIDNTNYVCSFYDYVENMDVDELSEVTGLDDAEQVRKACLDGVNIWLGE